MRVAGRGQHNLMAATYRKGPAHTALRPAGEAGTAVNPSQGPRPTTDQTAYGCCKMNQPCTTPGYFRCYLGSALQDSLARLPAAYSLATSRTTHRPSKDSSRPWAHVCCHAGLGVHSGPCQPIIECQHQQCRLSAHQHPSRTSVPGQTLKTRRTVATAARPQSRMRPGAACGNRNAGTLNANQRIENPWRISPACDSLHLPPHTHPHTSADE